MRFLVTSGGTKVQIDEARHIGNMSSGRFGSQIAWELLQQGHRVRYLYAKGAAAPHVTTVDAFGKDYVEAVSRAVSRREYFLKDQADGNFLYIPSEYGDFDDYVDAVMTSVAQADVVMLAAAVSDYGPEPTAGKISSDEDELLIRMKKLPKIITKVKQWNPEAFLVGFKLLIGSNKDQRHHAAMKQIEAAGSDLVVVNDLAEMKENRHTLCLYDKSGMIDKIGPHINLALELAEKVAELAKNKVTQS